MKFKNTSSRESGRVCPPTHLFSPPPSSVWIDIEYEVQIRFLAFFRRF